MKTFIQFLSLMTLIAIISFAQVNTIAAQRDHRPNQRDHRSPVKTAEKVRMLPQKTNLRDHRNDQIDGGPGNDQIRGGNGNDILKRSIRDQRSRPTNTAPSNRQAATTVRSKVDPRKSKAGIQRTSYHSDSIKVSSLKSKQNIIARDHRSQPKKASVRDHRNQPNRSNVRDQRKGSERISRATPTSPTISKNYRLNVFGKFIPFTPPFNVNIPKGFVAKGLGHCVSIPCPEGFGEDTVCWRCTEPPAPKPSAPDTKATKN